MENVQVQSVNDCRAFESVRVQLRKLARVSKNMVFERALQRLPCPQSTLHGWKGLVMA
jgi:hypothetical protein